MENYTDKEYTLFDLLNKSRQTLVTEFKSKAPKLETIYQELLDVQIAIAENESDSQLLLKENTNNLTTIIKHLGSQEQHPTRQYNIKWKSVI